MDYKNIGFRMENYMILQIIISEKNTENHAGGILMARKSMNGITPTVNFMDYKRDGILLKVRQEFHITGNGINIIINGKQHGLQEGWYEDGEEKYNENYYHGTEESIVKKALVIVIIALRKAKWYRLSRLVKTREFVEWWYHPSNHGGKIDKMRIELVFSSCDNNRKK